MNKPIHDLLQKYYPFTSHYLDVDGLRYHYLDEGQGDAIVMLHGNPTWSFYYRNLIIKLRDSYRVIVPDHIGCGLSDKPQQYPYRLENHIDNLTRLIVQLGLRRVSLFLHDWGGPIGLGYAVQHPDAIQKIVLFNTTVSGARNLPWRILVCKLPIVGDALIRGLNLFALAASSWAVANCRLSADIKNAYLFPYDNYRNRIATLRFVQDIPLTKRHPTWKRVAEIQDKLNVLNEKKILICWGDRDFCFTERFLRAWQETYPHAIVQRFSQAGHYVVEDAGAELQQILPEFMSGD